jgi:hypothetical protein
LNETEVLLKHGCYKELGVSHFSLEGDKNF